MRPYKDALPSFFFPQVCRLEQSDTALEISAGNDGNNDLCVWRLRIEGKKVVEKMVRASEQVAKVTPKARTRTKER